MNLAIHSIEANLGPAPADTFLRDAHPDLKDDFVLANPPFYDSDWHRSDEDVRWRYGLPPKGNANFAWVQHFIHHCSPNGFACFVLANGSMSRNQSGEEEIRNAIIDADLASNRVRTVQTHLCTPVTFKCLEHLREWREDETGCGVEESKM